MPDAKPIRPGVYPEMSHRDYHSAPGISFSYLYKMDGATPAHAKLPDKDTGPKNLGIAAHILSLEGEEAFASEVVEADAGTITAKEYEKTRLLNPGKTVLLRGETDLCRRMRDSIQGHKEAREMLRFGRAEVSAFITDAEGDLLRSRVDFDAPSCSSIIDLKFMREGAATDPRQFERELLDKYAKQAGMYRHVFSAATGRQYDRFVFIVVEKVPPYAVAVYTIDDAYMNWGWARCLELLEIEKKCRKANHWPNYTTDSFHDLYLPEWANK